MIKTARQLKDLIRNLSREKSADAQLLMRNYMMERFLERISLSEYRDKFILKGGMLVAAMVGLDARSTMDLDAMPPFDVLPLLSAGRSRRLTLVPIIQSLAQLEKNYGKEGSEIIQDNCQDTIFGGFAPNSQTAEVLSKALGNRTVLSGSVSRGKNDPSQSLQMMERPLLTPDELKSIPKGNFIVQKTGQHPMRTRLRLFLEWGITFEEPYIVPERADRAVAYANREDLERNLPQSSKAENADMRGAYAVSGSGGIAHEPAVDKPRRRGGKQMKTYGEEDL